MSNDDIGTMEKSAKYCKKCSKLLIRKQCPDGHIQ